MRPAWNSDTKTFAGGAAVALAFGLLLGGAMQPDFGDDGRPAGPQQIAGVAAMRSAGLPDADVSLASYGASVPDYVLGTDRARAAPPLGARGAVSGLDPSADLREPAQAHDADWPRPLTRAAYLDPPPVHSTYPSLGGGVAPSEAPPDDADAGPMD